MCCASHAAKGQGLFNPNTRMKAIIHHAVPTESRLLMPAPSVTDCEYITSAINAHPAPPFKNLEDFVGKPLEVLADYRTNMFYLEGGVSFYRCHPTTKGGHGYAGTPSSGCREKGHMPWRGGSFTIDVEFI